LKKGCFATILAWTSMLLLVFAWLFFGIFYGAGAFLDDTCVQLQTWTECNTPATKATAKGCNKLKITEFIKCPDTSVFKKSYDDNVKKTQGLINGYKAAHDTVKFEDPTAAPYKLSVTTYNKWDPNRKWRTAQYKLVGGTCKTQVTKSDLKASAACLACSGAAMATPTSDVCMQKSIVLTSDVLWGASYVASCNFMTAIGASVTAKDGACNKLGDGLVLTFAAFGLIGSLYIIVVIVAIRGRGSWDEAHFKSERAEETPVVALKEVGP